MWKTVDYSNKINYQVRKILHVKYYNLTERIILNTCIQDLQA